MRGGGQKIRKKILRTSYMEAPLRIIGSDWGKGMPPRLPKSTRVPHSIWTELPNFVARVRAATVRTWQFAAEGASLKPELPLYRGPQNRLEVARFLRKRGSQFLFLGNQATRMGRSISKESRFTIPFSGNHATSRTDMLKRPMLGCVIPASWLPLGLGRVHAA